MDAIIAKFASNTPVLLLDRHRQHMRYISSLICNTLMKPCCQINAKFAGEGDPEYISTGSNAEGASLARQFSNDDNTATEIEIDIMIVFMICKSEVGITYVENNKAFVHIKVEESAAAVYTSVYGEEALRKMLCQKSDGFYVSAYNSKDIIQLEMAKSPKLFENMGFVPCSVDKECDVRSASVALSMNFKNDVDCLSQSQQRTGKLSCTGSGEADTTVTWDQTAMQAQINANASSRTMELIQQMKPHFEQFEARIGEMMTHLEVLQAEFIEMRSQETAVSLSTQVEKALEWATACIDITDFIFDTRRATLCHFMHEIGGINPEAMEEGSRNKLKQKIDQWIHQLDILAEQISVSSAAEDITRILADIHLSYIAPRRFMYVFREFARWQTMLFNIATTVDQHPELNQISPDLLLLGRTMNKFSIDVVPCCKLTFWPSAVAEWQTRERVWPDQSVIDEIVNKGSHLVGKAYCHDDIDWRLSFSVAEIDLATRWSPAQHFVYFIFKSLFYKYIKPLSDDDTAAASHITSIKKYVASYTAKTVMMWTSESFEQSWWTEHNASECLTVLLLALQSAFECRKLAHYFVVSTNLLEGLPEVLAKRVIDTIDSILADPVTIADQLENHFERTKMWLDAMFVQRAHLDRFHSCLRDFGCYP